MPSDIGRFHPTLQTRMGRMLSAGRVTITMRSLRSGAHITLTLQSKAKIDNKWQSVPFAEATHVFISQGSGGWGAPKVGTYYPGSGKLYLSQGFNTPAWEFAIRHTLLASGSGQQDTSLYEIREADVCGRCGKELTDPESIARGLGPHCYGASTDSHHYRREAEPKVETVETPVFVAVKDKRVRECPRTFAALAAQVRR